MDLEKTDRGVDEKDVIEALGKGLRVIEAFDNDHAFLTPSEAAKASGITRTAARRYLLSLCHFGYADTDGRRFWLLPRVLRLGQSYLAGARLPRLVHPFIQRVAQQLGEAVSLSALDGHDVVYLAHSSSPRLFNIGFQVGARVPAHLVTPGVTMLSTLDDAALERWAAAHHFSTFTAETISDPGRFVEHVKRARGLGFWIAERQLDPGLQGIAVALRDRKGTCVGAIGMTISTQRMSQGQMAERLLPPLQEAATLLRDLL